MRRSFQIQLVFLYFLSLAFLQPYECMAQSKQKKARISVEYTKIMNKESFLSISAKYRGDSGFEPVSGLELAIYNIVQNDSNIPLGKVITNNKGIGKFKLALDQINRYDSIPTYHFAIALEQNDEFSDTDKRISFRDADLLANIIQKDSTYSVEATLTDPVYDKPIAEEVLQVRLVRLFKPYPISKGLELTDENGTIVVPIEEGLPGIDGQLTFEVILEESETYGTIKTIITEKIGVPIVDLSTFDERTMWSPPTKTPLFLWIFPNLIILGVWITIFILILNLRRISKAKNYEDY